MNLRGFNELRHFSVYEDSFRDVTNTWRPDPIWLTITCSKQKTYSDQFERPRICDRRQVKTTDICNLNIHYLQRLMVNIILGAMIAKMFVGKRLFHVWCVLTGTHADTGAFIICHMMEVAKTTHKNVIGVGPSSRPARKP